MQIYFLGKTITIDWLAGFSNSSAQYLEASYNDLLIFKWNGSHNLYLLRDRKAFDNCDFSGAHFAGDRSPIRARLLGEPPIMYYLACNEPGDCVAGQKLAVSTGDIKF